MRVCSSVWYGEGVTEIPTFQDYEHEQKHIHSPKQIRDQGPAQQKSEDGTCGHRRGQALMFLEGEALNAPWKQTCRRQYDRQTDR